MSTQIDAKKQIITLGLLSLGVFSFFCLAAVLEEKLFRDNDRQFKFGWFLTFIQLVFVTAFSALERIYFKEQVLAHNAELKRHALVAGAMTASRGLTNVSLQFLNYPTQVVFKSLKLLTVMIGSACHVDMCCC
jgi:adenosine 3'-phospho 5'-phosphosulfate transporter B3